MKVDLFVFLENSKEIIKILTGECLRQRDILRLWGGKEVYDCIQRYYDK